MVSLSQNSALTKSFLTSFVGVKPMGTDIPTSLPSSSSSTSSSSSWLSWGFSSSTSSSSAPALTSVPQSASSSIHSPLTTFTTQYSSQIVLYYCTGIISSSSHKNIPPTLSSRELSTPPTSTVNALGYLYITQGYIGIYFRSALISGVLIKELYHLADLQDIQLIDRSKPSTTSTTQTNSNTSITPSSRIPLNDEDDFEFFSNNSHPPSSAAPSITANQSSTPSTSTSTSTSSSMFSSFQQSLGLSHLSYECDLVFKTRIYHTNGLEEDCYHLITITPALISAEKLFNVLLEVKDMINGIPAGP